MEEISLNNISNKFVMEEIPYKFVRNVKWKKFI